MVDATGLENSLSDMTDQLKSVEQYVVNMQKHASGNTGGLFSHNATTNGVDEEIANALRGGHTLMEDLRSARDVSNNQSPDPAHD